MNEAIFSDIKLLALDVDGVLTDGKLYLGPNKTELKAFHVHDGYGIKQLMSSGVHVTVISSRFSEAAENRLIELGISHYSLGEPNKIQALEKVLQELGISFGETAYMGDDWPDYAVMQKVGLPIAVANATDAIKNIAKWQTKKSGGEGAVREICDLLLVKKCAQVPGPQ
jgi:3-deoxy-D-manno-octulosonate 8-phosphate phosphatase (KDO 8-P phosphatase)